jgi:hypothetical protein
MRQYIGTKIINAVPMNRLEYNKLRGWEVPADENPFDDGYLVEYVDGGKPNHPGYAGYISWSPKDVFERAYQPTAGMEFGMAIRALKQGAKVTRSGWNGKGMWLILVSGQPEVNTFPNSAYYNAGVKQCEILPHIDMWTVNAQGRRAMLPGWLASQSDMLAEDWMIVE